MIEYLREKVKETVDDILENDTYENRKENLKNLTVTLSVMCDCFGLITHEQAQGLIEPIEKELKTL